MERTKVYFRADGNSQIGLGHVYRSLALADMLFKDFDCFFLIQHPSESLIQRIQETATIIPLSTSSNLVQEASAIANNYLHGNEIVVLDGYHFDTDYQGEIKKKGSKLVCIDDIHAYHFLADVLINHAGGVAVSQYSKETTTLCYFGVEYALLQQPFLKAASNKKYSSHTRCFVCMGGADPNNNTLDILQFIEKQTPSMEVYLVLGSAYQHTNSLEEFLESTPLKVSILRNLSASEMVQYMQLCSIGICPPSTIAYEYSSVGGLLYLFQIADNQSEVYQHFIKEKLAYPLNNYPPTLEQEEELLAVQKAKFDGSSNRRLTRIFLNLQRELKVQIRAARLEDMMLYFDWANEPKTRNSGFNTAPIALSNHKEWFTNKVQDTATKLYLFEVEQAPIGQVRLVKENTDTCVISFSVDSHYHGLGYGLIILRMAIRKALKDNFCKKFKGYVRLENMASLKIFERLNFTYQADTAFNNIPCKTVFLQP